MASAVTGPAGVPACKRHALRERFARLETSNVADVLDQLGHPDQALAPGFVPFTGSTDRLAGWAYTFRGQMTPYEATGDAEKMRACQGIGASEVSVWSGDEQGVCYFGELIALGMQSRGAVGALVEGGVRDGRWLTEHRFPTFARYRSPTQSIGRWRVTAWQVPVYLAGATSARVTVHPGDFILADTDGAIVIPASILDRVLVDTERMSATEIEVRAAIAQGVSLEECLRRFGHV